MRLPLLAAAVAATAATALPAHAALYPVCATRVEPTTTSNYCTTGNNPFARATRTLRVVVATGGVDATITCNNPSGAVSSTGRVYPGKVGTFSVIERGASCTARLVSVEPGTTAVGLSTFTPVLIQEPTP